MSFNPTQEQKDIVAHDFKVNPVLRVIALSGTGKTSVLESLARANSHLRILYLAFGRDIRNEAAAKFPKENVECKTSHQLAWVFGNKYKHRLVGNLPMREVSTLLAINDWLVIKGAMQTLTNYLASADSGITAKHLCKESVIDAGKPNSKTNEAKLIQMLSGAKKIWSAMIDEASSFPVVHDTYLKLYQLSKPDLSRYDMILFDESQDANPVTTDIVMRQKQSYRVFVADTHQQIFRFRGAENAMDSPSLKGVPSLYLTGSFRFNKNVAAAANAILSVTKGETLRVTGLASKEDEVISKDAFDEALNSGNYKGEVMALSRTGAGVLETALSAMVKGKLVYWIGTPQGYGINDLQNLFYFKDGDFNKITNKKLLYDYADYNEYKQIAEDSGDNEMNKLIRLLEEYGGAVPNLISRIRNYSTDIRSKADLVVSSAHRSKGLESKFVKLNDDWNDITDPNVLSKMSRETMIDEMNLLYVAATRTKEGLVPNAILEHIIRNYIIQLRNPNEVHLPMIHGLKSEYEA